MKKTYIIIIVLFISMIIWNWAIAIQLTQADCTSYAAVSHNIVWAKSVGADKEKVRASIAEWVTLDSDNAMKLALREFEKLWATHAPAMSVANWIYRDCLSRGGIYPDSV